MSNAAYVNFLTYVLGKTPAGLVPFEITQPPRPNLLRLIFDPNGVRKMIVNWEPIAKACSIRLIEGRHGRATRRCRRL